MVSAYYLDIFQRCGSLLQVNKRLTDSNPDISDAGGLLIPYNFCIKTLLKEFDCYLKIRCKKMNMIK